MEYVITALLVAIGGLIFWGMDLRAQLHVEQVVRKAEARFSNLKLEMSEIVSDSWHELANLRKQPVGLTFDDWTNNPPPDVEEIEPSGAIAGCICDDCEGRRAAYSASEELREHQEQYDQARANAMMEEISSDAN